MRNAIGAIASLFVFAAAFVANPSLAAAAPANDNWANATVIGSLPFSTATPGPEPDLTEATVEATDPDPPPCLPVQNSVIGTVWYKYTTGANVEYLTLQSPVALSDHTHPLVLIAVYTGAPGAFSIVSGGCNSYSDSIFSARIAGLRLAPNTIYSIEVAVVTAGGTGDTLVFTADPAQQYHVTATADADTGSCGATCSLRDAISASNANPGAVIIPAGTYVLSGTPNETLNATGDLDATQGMGIYGAGIGKTIIDANHVDRVLSLDPNRVGTMAFAVGDLTLTNGTAPAPGPGQPFCAANGGGLCAPNGNGLNDFVGLERIAVTSSTGAGGGGIEINTPGTIRDSWIANNTATAFYGGGLDAVSDGSRPMIISGSTISGNTVSGPAGGAGIYAQGLVSLINSTISGNESRSQGGGIWFSGSGGKLSIASSTIVWNTAFYDNTAKTDVGGGLFLEGDAHSIVNSIIAYNNGGDPNPIYEDDCYLLSGTLTASYNIVQGPDNCPFTAGDTHIDPKLLPNLSDNGGLTPTHYLYGDSPAIDAGDPAGCKDPDGLLLAYDQRGPGFPRVSGAQCDKGAVEWSNIIFQNGFEPAP